MRDVCRAGYTKIHLDASMPLDDDPLNEHDGLELDVVARREARLAAAAEAAVRQAGGSPPVYVIGTEVPPPGGIQADEAAVAVTRVEQFEQTIAECKREFGANDMQDAWERVIAVVVQPGVEFGDHVVYEYDRFKARELVAAARRHPELMLEGHSTDYQRAELLRFLVEDGIAILKVGSALTFAMRECLFALERFEIELLGSSYRARLSELQLFLEKAMNDNPTNWQSYYTGSAQEIHLARKYSLSDRSRYYWQVPMVKGAVELLLKNLGQVEIPLTLISQYLPRHFLDIRKGSLGTTPVELIEASIRMTLQDYSAAVQPMKQETE